MPALTVHNLHKSFGTRAVFDGVSFSVEEGEKVGFIGVNGSGKSTLFKVVAGDEGHAGGTIALQRGLSVGYLSQEPAFEPGATIVEAVASGQPELLRALTEYHQIGDRMSGGEAEVDRLLARQSALLERIEAMDGWALEHRMEAILTRLGVEERFRTVDALSGGERKRIALARVLVQQPQLLLLDEPTNHLDADTTLWLESYLGDYPGAVMLITHDRYFLDRVVTRMIEVDRAELTSYRGGYTEYLEAKAERQARMAVAEEKRAKLIEQELAWVRRAPSARTGKQKARIRRLDDTEREQEEKQLPTRDAAEIKFGRPPRLGRTVLDLAGISKSYDDRTLVRDFTTILRAGERIGIVGPNGAGKTTLLRIILGEEAPDEGEVVLGKNTEIAYFDQKREDLDPAHTLLEAVASQDWVEVAGRRMHVRSYLSSFLFPTAMQDQRVASLSGGERNRLLLARLLLEDANLLVLDEPTNDLDLVTLQVLEEALVDFPGCVLVVTHDRFFLDKIATGLFVFEGDGVVHRHEGSYEFYRRLRDEKIAPAAEDESRRATPRRQPPLRKQEATGRRKLTYREQQELKGMEEAILDAEEEREKLEARLGDPTLYAEAPEEVGEITDRLSEVKQTIDRLYARWQELEAIREGT